VHYIRKDTNAGNALLNEFGNSKDELERFTFALAEYGIAGAPGGRDQTLRWAQQLVERSETGDQAWKKGLGAADRGQHGSGHDRT